MVKAIARSGVTFITMYCCILSCKLHLTVKATERKSCTATPQTDPCQQPCQTVALCIASIPLDQQRHIQLQLNFDFQGQAHQTTYGISSHLSTNAHSYIATELHFQGERSPNCARYVFVRLSPLLIRTPLQMNFTLQRPESQTHSCMVFQLFSPLSMHCCN